MKKSLAVLFAVVFCFAFSLNVFAAGYKIDANGDAYYDSAIGYTFRIDGVNRPITGEDSSICTTNDAINSQSTSWAIWFKAEKVSPHVYKVITDGKAMGGTKLVGDIKEGEVVFIFHSSTSNPDKKSDYPNFEDKVAALATKKGNYIIIEGVDLANATGNGTAKCVSEADGKAFAATDVEEEVSVSAPDESSEDGSATESAVGSAVESSEDEAPVSEAESEAEAASDPEITTSTMSTAQGMPGWLWGLIIGVAVIVVCAIIIIVNKNKQK